MNETVLIVEDEPLISQMLAAMVEDFGLHVCGVARSADQAVQLAGQLNPQLVLMDVRLNGSRDGVDAAIAIHQFSTAPIIYLTGSREPETLERIMTDHPAGVVYKPMRPNQLEEMITKVLNAA